MRTLLKCAALAVIAAALLACDDEEPVQGGGSVSLAVGITTSEMTIGKADVWEVWEDITFPRDNVPDRPKRDFQPDGPQVYQCDSVVEDPPVTSSQVAPWGFSVEVSVLRKGSTTAEIISTTSTQTSRFTGAPILPPTTDVPTPVADKTPTPPSFYLNGKRMSLANPEYALKCLDLVIDPNLGPLTNAHALLDNPGTVNLNPGDTIIVQARKATPEQNPYLGNYLNGLSPKLLGGVSINGRPVTPTGTAESTDESGSGISFSYTVN